LENKLINTIMSQERMYKDLMVGLEKLNQQILVMHEVIDKYIEVLLDLDPNTLESMTDTYHNESLTYSNLQEELVHLMATIELDGQDSTIKSIVGTCKNLGFEIIANSIEDLRLAAKENAILMDQKHSKMINLLLFASSCNADTLKDIYSLANNDYKAYDATGQLDMNGVGIGLNHQV
jgi:hypothetical protein